jgi:predicted nuclease of predicted toxin-antitoxin system
MNGIAVARLYRNENFPQPVVLALRALGHDVLTVLKTGRSDQAWPDEEVLAYALRENRILLTLNRKHFIRLHQTGCPHPGIVVCTLDLDFARQASRIHEAMRNSPSLAGQLVRVNRPA